MIPDRLELKQVFNLLQIADPSSALFRRSRELLEGKLEIEPPIPKATPPQERRFLTIGMATAKDYDGVYFTIQAIRLGHPEILHDVDFLVLDNDPTGPCAPALHRLGDWCPNYRYLPYKTSQGTAVRDLIFREAAGDFVLCVDSHVLFAPGSLARFIEYCRQNPCSNDLLQGTLLSDAMEPIATHFEPVWSAGMYGYWGLDERGKDVDAPPFEIGMQGLGVFGCRREAWPGFNPRLAGFGGEEGYIHLKIGRAGGRSLCLPFLRWLHRFERPMGVSYPCSWEDRIRNYLLIYDELDLDPEPAISHFEEFLGRETAQAIIRSVQAEIASPFHFFDAICCINLDREPDRWATMQGRFRELGIERKVRRFSAAETPLNHRIGCALSHRRIVAEAKRQRLKNVLVLEDDVRFSQEAAAVLHQALRELEGRDWQILYLGGGFPQDSFRSVPGCDHIQVADLASCTHAVAYHHTVYDAVLNAIPDNPIDAALWIGSGPAIDGLYPLNLRAAAFITNPVVATHGSLPAHPVTTDENNLKIKHQSSGRASHAVRTTLCVMFNHPYVKNIPLIRETFRASFDSVMFVVPYTASSDEDAITSYRGSYGFQGYIVDAAQKLLQSDADYFFFMQDDVVLNPYLTGDILVEKLRLREGGAFIPAFRPLAGELRDWDWTLASLWKILFPMNRISGGGAEAWLAALPAAEEAFSKLRTQYGFDFPPITFDRNNKGVFHNAVPDPYYSTCIYKAAAEGLFETADGRSSVRLPYPFCYGMSDFFAVDRETLIAMLHPLGVFSAAGLFVETAIPTAIAVAARRVMRSADAGMVANWFWGNHRQTLDVNTIKKQFERNLLLVHPIKISQDEALYRALRELPADNGQGAPDASATTCSSKPSQASGVIV